MRKYNGCSSESKKCLFCNKVTSDYVCYEVEGITIELHSHLDCNHKTITIDDVMKKAFRKLKQDIKFELSIRG